jgi:hypothetical protein
MISPFVQRVGPSRRRERRITRRPARAAWPVARRRIRPSRWPHSTIPHLGGEQAPLRLRGADSTEGSGRIGTGSRRCCPPALAARPVGTPGRGGVYLNIIAIEQAPAAAPKAKRRRPCCARLWTQTTVRWWLVDIQAVHLRHQRPRVPRTGNRGPYHVARVQNHRGAYKRPRPELGTGGVLFTTRPSRPRPRSGRRRQPGRQLRR